MSESLSCPRTSILSKVTPERYASIRLTRAGAVISILNTATVLFFSKQLTAMFSASAVLPTPGRAARMTKSPGFKPFVFLSRLVNPVKIRLLGVLPACASCMFWKAVARASFAWVSALSVFSSAILNTSCSALPRASAPSSQV